MFKAFNSSFAFSIAITIVIIQIAKSFAVSPVTTVVIVLIIVPSIKLIFKGCLIRLIETKRIYLL
jgi:hypothetical protein